MRKSIFGENLLRTVLKRMALPETFSRHSSYQPPDGIYVQLLPTIVNEANLMSSKILLCKWTAGDYKDRYTGLIKALPTTDLHSLINPKKHRSLMEKHTLLKTFAHRLLPASLQTHLKSINLVALLRFDDKPVYDEYVFLATLQPSNEPSKFLQSKLFFDGHPLQWFSWNDIPFSQMPQDDEIWYPKVLQGQEKVTGSFNFGGWSEKTLKSFHIETVKSI